MARTDSFRAQHKKALELVGLIQADLDPNKLGKDAQGIVMNLAKLAGTINLHLSMEDQSLYPAMISSKNPQVKQAAEKFIKEMSGIAQAFTSYYKKWNAQTIQGTPDAFIKETKGIFTALGDRIRREEAELYPLADQN